MDQSARKPSSEAPYSSNRPRGHAFAIRYRGRDLPLSKPETVIGRSSDCDIVFDSTLVSRRHARILLSGESVSVEDLGSRNGVLVNSRQITGRCPVLPGDTIALGDEMLELINARPEYKSDRVASRFRAAQTLDRVPTIDTDEPLAEEYTRRANAFELLAGVVEKQLALGHGDEAERVLQLHLVRVLDEARTVRSISPETALTAARFAVKLAAATGKGVWVDYCVRLHRFIAKPMPLPIIDELYTLLRKVNGIDKSLLREYVATLRSQAASYTASERFALQRIEGLERLASL